MGGKTKLSPAEYHRQYRARKAAERAAAEAAAKQSTPQPAPAPAPPLDDDSALWLDDPPSSDNSLPASAPSAAQPHPAGDGGGLVAPVATMQLHNVVTVAGKAMAACKVDKTENSISKGNQKAGVKGKREAGESQEEAQSGEKRGEREGEKAAKADTAKQGETAEREGFSGAALSALRTREAMDILGQEKQNVQRCPTPDFKPAKFAAPPCSLEVFERVCYRMMRGDFWRDIAKDEGGLLWENVRACAGQSPELSARWVAVDNARRAAIEADISETGQILLATARAELPAVEESGDTPHGPTTRRSYQRAASTAQAGAALLQPATHGKLAAQRDAPGSGSGSIIVNIAVAPGILPPGAPPVIQIKAPQGEITPDCTDAPPQN